jgi:hypothetical protein
LKKEAKNFCLAVADSGPSPGLYPMVAQLRELGVEVEVDEAIYSMGQFASLKDPEGNPIQLWQPQ